MRIRFWGVRGSIPTPIGSEAIKDKIIRALGGAKGVDLNDPQAVRGYVESLPMDIRGTAGGNTACVEVAAGGHCLILDAGSGLRGLGLSLLKGPFGRGEGTAHIFMSHTHWDHIQGFPFFVPAYIPGNELFIYSPKVDLKDKFATQQLDQDMFPVRLENMAATTEFVTMGSEGVDLDGVKVDFLKTRHPGGSYAYRIKEHDQILVYATDAEYQKLGREALQPYLDFYSGADLLIFDAQYTITESAAKEGWGHSTSTVGVDIAVKTGAKRLILFHHDPAYTDAKLQEILDRTYAYYSYLAKGSRSLEIVLAVEEMELEI